MFCRGCDYPLRRLDVGRCPECGRPFDPGDRGSYALVPGETRRLVRSVALSILVNVLLVAALLLFCRAIMLLFFS